MEIKGTAVQNINSRETTSTMSQPTHGNPPIINSNQAPGTIPPVAEPRVPHATTDANYVEYVNGQVNERVSELHALYRQPPLENGARVIFVQKRDLFVGKRDDFPRPRHPSSKCDECWDHLRSDFGWPDDFFRDACVDSNGFVRDTYILNPNALPKNPSTVNTSSVTVTTTNPITTNSSAPNASTSNSSTASSSPTTTPPANASAITPWLTDDRLLVKHLRCLVKYTKVDEAPKGELNDANNNSNNKKNKTKTKDVKKKEKPVPHVEYDWYELSISIRENGPNSISIIVFGMPDPEIFVNDFHQKFAKSLRTLEHDAQWENSGRNERVVAALMQEIVNLYDESVWSISKAIRKIEKDRSPKGPKYFHYMHELLRHTIHTTEVLEVTEGSLREMSKASKGKNALPNIIGVSHQAAEQFEFWSRLLHNYMLRSRSNDARLKNEIDLALNMVAQKDSAVNVKIGKAAAQDSASMKVISIVTLLFLPATFLATIFGMSFFNYSKADGWSQSDQVYIFWVTAVLLTMLAFAFYFFGDPIWRKIRSKQIDNEDEDEDEDQPQEKTTSTASGANSNRQKLNQPNGHAGDHNV